MKQFLITFFAVIFGLVVFVLSVPLVGLLITAPPDVSLPNTTILSLDLNQVIPEAPNNDPFSRFLEHQGLSVPEIVSVLHRASDDSKVKGLYVKLGSIGMRTAQAQEFRDAIKFFRASGKFAVAYAQQFSGNGMGAYYTAAACDEIWLQTTGESHVSGIAVSAPFIKQTLDKIGVSPQLGRRHEYKTAANTFTESDFTKVHRQSLERFIGSMFNRITSEISSDRDFTPQELIDHIDSAPHTAEEALNVGLVDKLGYEDQVRASLIDRTGEDVEFVSVQDYFGLAGGNYEDGKTIALIYGTGTIVSGKSGGRGGPLSQNVTMGSDTIAQAFRDAVDDEDVEAIVFRVSSPGGSYLASDQIWREIVRARKAGIPVVATMGATAASGGYFVAMAADIVIAQAGTITGSIGVLGGKMVAADLLSKLGINLGEVSIGKNALIGSSFRNYTPEQWTWINRSLDRVYSDFTSKVATARDLSTEQVNDVARGRIWTGDDAVRNGLIDKIGGFADAIDQAKVLAGIDVASPIQLKQYPKSVTFSEQMLSLIGGLEGVIQAATLLQAVAHNLRIQETLTPLANAPSGVLTMPTLYRVP